MAKIKSLSFCLKSRGERDDYLYRLILSIHLQRITVPYEILVCGHTDLRQTDVGFTSFRLIEDKEDAFNGKLGKMNNILAQSSRNEALVYLDDDSELMPYWWHNVEKLDLNDFDLTPFGLYQLEKDHLLRRWYDWAKVVPGRLVLKGFNDPADKTTYIGGGSLIVKKSVAIDVKWIEGNHEDSPFCFKCFEKGYKLKAFPFMQNAVCMHFLCREGRG